MTTHIHYRTPPDLPHAGSLWGWGSGGTLIADMPSSRFAAPHDGVQKRPVLGIVFALGFSAVCWAGIALALL